MKFKKLGRFFLIKKSCFLLSFLVSFSLFLPQTSSWDGQRKGFLLGMGLGPGITLYRETTWRGADAESREEIHLSIAVNPKIGYALTNQLQAYISFPSLYFLEKRAEEKSEMTTLTSAYYFRPEYPTYFLSAGLGLASRRFLNAEGNQPLHGIGLLLGVGYEIKRHISLELILTGRYLTSSWDEEPTRSVISLVPALSFNILGY